MDISKIIDTADTRPTHKPSAIFPPRQEYRSVRNDPSALSSIQTPIYDGPHDIRHPQPSPLQTPGYHDSRVQHSSSYSSDQSPYHHTHSSSLNGVRYPSPQHYQNLPNGHLSLQREDRSSSSTANYHASDQMTPIAHTPTGSTPGSASAYSNWPRPTSSHSIQTPNSAHQPTSFFRGSPQASHSQVKSWSQSHSMPQYPSQPSTPLGPPLTRSRPSLEMSQPSPGSYSHSRSFSGGFNGQQQIQSPPAIAPESPSGYGSTHRQPNVRQDTDFRKRELSLSVSPKTRIESLPTTDSLGMVANNGSGPREQVRRLGERFGDEAMTSVDSSEQRIRPPPRHSNSVGIHDLLNADPSPGNSNSTKSLSKNYEHHNTLHRDSSNGEIHTGNLDIDRSTTQGRANVSPKSNRPPFQQPSPLNPGSAQRLSLPSQTPTPPASGHQSFNTAPPLVSNVEIPTSAIDTMVAPVAKANGAPSKLPSEHPKQDGLSVNEALKSRDAEMAQISVPVPSQSSQPAKKKQRLEEKVHPTKLQTFGKIENGLKSTSSEAPVQQLKKKPPRLPTPIFAQSVRNVDQNRKTTPAKRQPPASQVTPTPTSLQPAVQQQPSGHAQVNGALLPAPRPDIVNGGLGPWEPSILNIIPAEELVRVVSDFLFNEVVLRKDVGVGPAGGLANQGAVLEIEAKIGRLIDKSTMDRLRLPVMTECVVSQADPNLRISFESSMTEAQHRTLNGFLNKALIATQPVKPTPQVPNPPPNSRIQMNYKHTRETDTFYDLSQAGQLSLPSSITSNFKTRQANKSKVRITHDQKTGQELANIVKARVADIDVYSPRTPFDWRVSVNVEMDFRGDLRDLVEPDRREGKNKADRNKDRMSYKHLAYQVDLTQVTPADATAKPEKEHELEIEVSSQEVRRQGLRAQSGEPNGYEELVRGFVDNVRVLARNCQ